MSGHALQPVEVTWGPRDQTGCQVLHVVQRCSCGRECEARNLVDTLGGNAGIKKLAEMELAWVGKHMAGHIAAHTEYTVVP